MNDTWSALVVVPAHDEEASIGECVASIRASLMAASISRSEIVVVADGCTDDTAREARRALGPAGVAVEIDARSAGVARRTGVRIGLERLARPLRSIWIANTDADTIVPAEWITRQLRHAERGAAAVAGVVRLRQPGDDLEAQFVRHYRWDPRRPHPHVHGANLGVRADVYEAVDGWSSLGLSEDHALWNSIRDHGWPAISATEVWVETSARLHGRVIGGFSGDLLRISGMDGA